MSTAASVPPRLTRGLSHPRRLRHQTRALLACVLGGAVVGCATPDFLVGETNTRPHEFALEQALKETDTTDLRDLCRNVQYFEPPGIYALFLRPWPNTGVQEKACNETRAKYDASVAKADKSARAGGIAHCIETVQLHYESNAHREGWGFDWESDEARRASLSPTIESCLLGAEAAIATDKHREVALSLLGHKPFDDAAVLNDEQRTRLKALIPEARNGAIKMWADAATKAKGQPLVEALYVAAQAVVTHNAGDKDGGVVLAKKAKALVKSAPSDAVRLSLSGRGLGQEIVQRLLRQSFNGDVVWDNASKNTIAVELSAAKISTGTDTVELSAEYQVQRGTRTNPAWADKNKDCETTARFLKQEEWSCDYHGSARNVACDQAISSRKKLNDCQQKRDAIKKDVPAFAMEKAPYSATEFSGYASGELVLDGSYLGAGKHKVTASERRYTHDAVSVAKLSATRSSPVSNSEMEGAYRASAASTVAEDIRSKIAKRRLSFLNTALTSDDEQEAANALVLFGLKESPDHKKLDPIGQKLVIPAYDAMRILRGD